MEKVQTPSNTFVNSIARLECHYDLEGEALYMVKWYKDNVEFYRYVPQDKPEAMVFHLHGIHVKVQYDHHYDQLCLQRNEIPYIFD